MFLIFRCEGVVCRCFAPGVCQGMFSPRAVAGWSHGLGRPDNRQTAIDISTFQLRLELQGLVQARADVQ